MSKEYLPSHIANYLLWKANDEGIKDMSPMKLIKLVYFCYAWNLAIYGKKLFSERIEAWKHGPVIPSIYHEFKRFGKENVTSYSIQFEQETGEITYPVINKDDTDTFLILDAVWNEYKNKTAWDIRHITHENGSPWNHAYEQGENTVLEDDKIINRALSAIKRVFERDLSEAKEEAFC